MFKWYFTLLTHTHTHTCVFTHSEDYVLNMSGNNENCPFISTCLRTGRLVNTFIRICHISDPEVLLISLFLITKVFIKDYQYIRNLENYTAVCNKMIITQTN